MDLIQIWKLRNKAKEEGRKTFKVRRKDSPIKYDLLLYQAFIDFVRCRKQEDCLADDWEIAKEQNKIVIENIKWHETLKGPTLLYYPYVFDDKFDWSDLVDKPNMKMTLEWEE